MAATRHHSWAHFTAAHESLALMGYTAEPADYPGINTSVVHVFWHSEHGRCCVGVASNPGTAMMSLAAMNWPTSLPDGLCQLCHPQEESA